MSGVEVTNTNSPYSLANITAALASLASAVRCGESMSLELERQVEAARASALYLDQKAKNAQTSIDNAYNERNRVVACLARMIIMCGGRAGRGRTAIAGWEPEWHNVVYVDTPWGQASWHYHDREAASFEDLPWYGGTWDGHTSDEKYRRLEGRLADLGAYPFFPYPMWRI